MRNVQLSRSLSFKASSGAPLVKAASLKTDKPDKPAGWKDMNGMEKLGVVEVDPLLTPHQTHLKYRVREYMKRQMEIQKFEGSLQDFAKGEQFLAPVTLVINVDVLECPKTSEVRLTGHSANFLLRLVKLL